MLASSGLVIAGLYLLSGNLEVGLLAAISAVTIPLVGDAELLYSTGVKFKNYRRVVAAQLAAAVGKIAVAIVIAATLASSIAFAVSTAAFYLLMDLALLSIARRSVIEDGDAIVRIELRTRVKWGLNSLFITLPIQIGFIVAQFTAPPDVLGIYFFAYQISLGLSGLVSVPLARVTLSTLAKVRDEERVRLSQDLCLFFVVVVSGVAAGVGLLLPSLAEILGGEWLPAGGATAVLLSSLAVRMMTPVLDGLQQAQNRWWQSTGFNIVDTVGTAAAALVALTGDIMLLVSAVAAWKIVFGLARGGWILRGGRRGRYSLTILFAVSASVMIAGSQFVSDTWSMPLLALVLACSVASMVIVLLRRRRR